MRWRTTLLLPVLTLSLMATLPKQVAVGQPNPAPVKLDGAAIDGLVSTTLREVLVRGVPLYNSGEFDGAYRLYEGALMSVKPLLAHRAELQKDIEGALILADRTEEVSKRAWVLRETMDKIRATVKGKPETPKPPKSATVTGIVSVDTVPLATGKINLFGSENRVYTADIKQGKYSIDKVLVGEYKVVIAEDPKEKVKIEPKYLGVGSTPIVLKVVDESPATFNFGVKGLVVPPPLSTVQGRIVFEGKPYAGAKIVLTAAGVGTKIGVSDKEGAFTIKDLKPATYKVILGEDVAGPKLDEKYLDPDTTPLRVEVKEGKASNFDISLQGKPKPPAVPRPERLKAAPKEVKTGTP